MPHDHGFGAPDDQGPDDDPCRDRRLLVEQHAAHAIRLRKLADESDLRVRQARRAWDAAGVAVQAAHHDVDPRLVAAAKESAREQYRRERAASRTPQARADAASRWMVEVDRINRDSARAAAALDAATIRLSQLQHAVGRSSALADAARISAESVEDAWRTARLELAACEETSVAPVMLSDDGSGRPLILRLLDGERAILPHVGAALAWEAGIDGGHTQLLLSELVEGINAMALEAHVLDFPDGHPFWGEFTLGECRELVRALRSLGYTTDGSGAWAHRHVPQQRDVATAIAAIGLDPRRVRRLPSGREIDELFRDVRVRSDEYLVSQAPDLSLTGVLAAIGARGGHLDGLWDSWGRVRPVLMTTQDPLTLD